jgi:hypothetical protein
MILGIDMDDAFMAITKDTASAPHLSAWSTIVDPGVSSRFCLRLTMDQLKDWVKR